VATARLQGRVLASFLLVALVVAALAVLISLGMWQLRRAAEKAAIRDAFETRSAAAPLRLGAERLDPVEHEFFRVAAKGTWQPRDQILIDNQVRQGQPGYRVMTPLKLKGADMSVLVDRGWIPWGPSRQVVPMAPAPEGEVTVEGLLRLPATDFYTLEKSAPGPGQPVWQNLDMARYRELTGLVLQDLIVVMSPESGGGGFARDWPKYTDAWIARHRGYALQWFGLAAVLVVVVVAAVLRRRIRSEETLDA
jgi:surfeit locus 1 family protein